MNIDLLLTPVSHDAPCGENLEYDPAFMQVCLLARGKPEQQFGDTIIPAVEPDWREVENRALSLLRRSKDLRLMLLLAQSWTALRALPGYADGMALLSEALVRYWPSLLPPLALDGEADPFVRINLLRELGDDFTLAKLLRHSRFMAAGAGQLTLAEAVASIDGSMPPGDYPGGPTRLAADIQRGIDALAGPIAQINTATGRIFSLLRHHLGDGALPEMTYQLSAMGALASAISPAPLAPDSAERPIPAAVLSPAAGAPAACHGAIRTRDEAYQALERVKTYFNRYESSHPAPLMIERVQLLMSRDFMAIVRNLAPDAVGQLEHFFGCDNQGSGNVE